MATTEKGPRRLWCAYLPDADPDMDEDDRSYTLFGTELAGLRYAADHGLACKPVLFGIPLHEQLKANGEPG